MVYKREWFLMRPVPPGGSRWGFDLSNSRFSPYCVMSLLCRSWLLFVLKSINIDDCTVTCCPKHKRLKQKSFSFPYFVREDLTYAIITSVCPPLCLFRLITFKTTDGFEWNFIWTPCHCRGIKSWTMRGQDMQHASAQRRMCITN
jgi:hypothetical protein